MVAFLVRRVALIAVVLLAMTFITFLMAEVIPGDPARAGAGLNASPDAIAAARERLGLDKPLLSQYWVRSGLSRPSRSRAAAIASGEAFSPAPALAGSPGMTSAIRKVMKVIASSTTAIRATRRTRNATICL